MSHFGHKQTFLSLFGSPAANLYVQGVLIATEEGSEFAEDLPVQALVWKINRGIIFRYARWARIYDWKRSHLIPIRPPKTTPYDLLAVPYNTTSNRWHDSRKSIRMQMHGMSSSLYFMVDNNLFFIDQMAQLPLQPHLTMDECQHERKSSCDRREESHRFCLPGLMIWTTAITYENPSTELSDPSKGKTVIFSIPGVKLPKVGRTRKMAQWWSFA